MAITIKGFARHSFRKGLFTTAMVLAALVFLGGGQAWASELTVNGTPGLNVNTSTVSMNCNDVTINNGGAIDLGSGRMEQCRNFLIESGGALVDGSGTITICGAWTNNSSFVKSSLSTIEFVSGCGVDNRVNGTGDTDGDGTADFREGLGDRNGNGIPDFLDPTYSAGGTGSLVPSLLLLLDE
jgi:hypothetical protein